MSCVEKENCCSAALESSPSPLPLPTMSSIERVERMTATSTTSPKSDTATTTCTQPSDTEEPAEQAAVAQAACDKKRKKRMKLTGGQNSGREAKQKKLEGVGRSISGLLDSARERETVTRISQDLPNCNWLEEKIKSGSSKSNKMSKRITKLFDSDSEEESLVMDEVFEDVAETKEENRNLPLVHSTLSEGREVRGDKSPPLEGREHQTLPLEERRGPQALSLERRGPQALTLERMGSQTSLPETITAQSPLGRRSDQKGNQSPPCITIAEDECQQPIQIRVSIQGGAEDLIMDDLEAEDTKDLDNNVAEPYNYVPGSYMKKMDHKENHNNISQKKLVADKKTKEKINELISVRADIEQDIESLKDKKIKEMEELLAIKNSKEMFMVELEDLRMNVYKEHTILQNMHEKILLAKHTAINAEDPEQPRRSKSPRHNEKQKVETISPQAHSSIQPEHSSSTSAQSPQQSHMPSPPQPTFTTSKSPTHLISSTAPSSHPTQPHNLSTKPPQLHLKSPQQLCPSEREGKEKSIQQGGVDIHPYQVPLLNLQASVYYNQGSSPGHLPPLGLLRKDLPLHNHEAFRHDLYKHMLESVARQNIRESPWLRAQEVQRAEDLSADTFSTSPHSRKATKDPQFQKSGIDFSDHNGRPGREDEALNQAGSAYLTSHHGLGLAKNQHTLCHNGLSQDPSFPVHPGIAFDPRLPPGSLSSDQRINSIGLPPDLRGSVLRGIPADIQGHGIRSPNSTLRSEGGIGQQRGSEGYAHPGFQTQMLNMMAAVPTSNGNVPSSRLTKRAPSNEPRAGASNSKCDVCGATANFMCSACKGAQYCSTICQRGHWMVHSRSCMQNMARMVNKQ